MSTEKIKVAVMQPYFLPYIGYFQLINSVEKFVFFDDVNFKVRGWINRNRILINGEPFLFSIPLKRNSQNKIINQIKIADELNWRDRFLKSVELSYKKAPFFNETFEIVAKVAEFDTSNLAYFIMNSIFVVNEHLKIKTALIPSSSIYKNKELKGEQRVLDICKKESAEIYINPYFGINLYNKEHFSSEGIKILFQRTKAIQYDQFKHDYINNLSIIDILMFNPKEQVKEYLDHYEVVE